MKEVKNNLRILMAKNKMTIRDVHKATGMSEVTISKLYHEKSNTIAFETIRKLCVLFDCTVDELLYLDEEGD
jgi:putative transcriptional regulator